MTKSRLYLESDYEILSKWWNDYGFLPPPSDFLPKNSGIVIEYNNTPVAVGFVYLLDCSAALFGWLLSDKNCETSIKNICIKELFNSAKDFCEKNNKKYIITWAGNKHLQRLFKQEGYVSCEENIISLGLPLKGDSIEWLK